MATQQIEIDIPIFERNLKLFNNKGLRRSFSSVINHKKEYMVIPPLSSSNEFMMEVTLDKEYAEMFMDLLTSNNLEDLGANPVLHLENLIKDYEANKEAFAAKVQEKGMSELYIPSEFMYKEEFPIFATGKADLITLKKWVQEQVK